MPGFLEVIVTSAEEAREAERGGADRLELVRAFEVGGLTPDLTSVEEVIRAISVPVRVMLRESASMSAEPEEIGRLRSVARQLAQFPIDGLVAGFAKDGRLDLDALGEVLAAAPGPRITMHRAFEDVTDPIAAIEQLKNFRQVDRILTSGGAGDWEQRRTNLLKWQAAAAPQMTILVGVGLCKSTLRELAQRAAEPAKSPQNFNNFEFHVGRAARLPHTVHGAVSREQIARLKALT